MNTTNDMNIVQRLLRGVRDPQRIQLENELRTESRKRDTLNAYARAAAKTYSETGRDSCLGAQTRFETAAIAAAARCQRLEAALGELVGPGGDK